jgi:hypothetical protein
MNMPRFTAEVSLSQRHKSFRLSADEIDILSRREIMPAEMVVPQVRGNVRFDVEIGRGHTPCVPCTLCWESGGELRCMSFFDCTGTYCR